ncbi:MAG: hypothetical protein EZS28_033197 [Streblomastix strix]|uniref:Uncharacterized protein n=1 Tax=Streblomastix strix TaxID=222440 RepID=A0A5J4UKT4_9EUKA|nr:MAG: hypothetical protein EZS28_033197 [Streblomastix strix]
MDPKSISVEVVGDIDYEPSENDYTQEENLFKHIKDHNSDCLITFDPAIQNGIAKFEIQIVGGFFDKPRLESSYINVFMTSVNDSFKITQFERLAEPSSQFKSGQSTPLEYGGFWELHDKKKCKIQ